MAVSARRVRRGRLPARRLPAARTWSRCTRPRWWRRASGRRLGLDGDVADVDDSRELADAVEEGAEVVDTCPRPAACNGSFRIQRLLHSVLRREALDRQVRLRRQALDAAQDVGDVLLLRQHGLRLSSRASSCATSAWNSRQPAGGGHAPWRRRREAATRRAWRVASSACDVRARRSTRSRTTAQSRRRRRRRRSAPCHGSLLSESSMMRCCPSRLLALRRRRGRRPAGAGDRRGASGSL